MKIIDEDQFGFRNKGQNLTKFSLYSARMKMEHRYSERITTDIQALIYKSGLPIAIARVRDMSRHGIFIDCLPDAVTINQPLKVELFSYGNRAEKSSLLSCFVARMEPEGVGLGFFDNCQPSYARYAESIIERQRVSAAIPSPHNANIERQHTFIPPKEPS